MKNPTIANTFRLLAKNGRKGFYEGPVAEALVKATSDRGGHLTLDDLKHHGDQGSEETDPISIKFNGQGIDKTHSEHGHSGGEGGVEIWEHPPNGQGIVALMALGMLEELEKTGKIKTWSQKDHNSVEWVAPHADLLPTLQR